MRSRGWLLATVLAVAACAPRQATEPFHGLPFVEDQFDVALARARQAAIPLFVEVWAPW